MFISKDTQHRNFIITSFYLPEIYEAFHKNNINKTENFRDKMTIELYLRTQGFF